MNDWLKQAQHTYALAGYAAEEAMAECRIMLAKCLDQPFETVWLEGNRELPRVIQQQLEAWMTQRLPTTDKPAEPLAYVLEEAWFFGQPYYVNPAVLIPRPETEVLVDWGIQWLKGQSLTVTTVLDVGTGSGCIACTVARHVTNVTIDAVDIDAAALAVARQNAIGLPIDFHLGYGMEPVIHKQYDLILSNPPYIPQADWDNLSPDVQQEPVQALLGGPDGLSVIRHLLAYGQARLKPGGHMGIELEYRQWNQVAKEAEDKDWRVHPPLLDVEGRERFIILSI